MFGSKTKTTMTINNIGYVGQSITIANGKVIIDGKDVTPEGKEINIKIDGNVDQLNVDVCNKISITGDVGSATTVSGNVDITGSVSGNVQTTSGDVECSDVNGSIKTTSGDVKCGDIKGPVSTISGDIKNKK